MRRKPRQEGFDEALCVAPGLAAAKLLEVRVGLRPNSTDGLPIWGTVPNTSNIYLATGHGASGLQLGPYSGEVLSEVMSGQTPDIDLTVFHVNRFL